MVTIDDSIDNALIERIVGEYREMPGLALTEAQACRLWGCDECTCRRLVELMVSRRLLRRSREGLLVRGW
jgi:hypothetical protein